MNQESQITNQMEIEITRNKYEKNAHFMVYVLCIEME